MEPNDSTDNMADPADPTDHGSHRSSDGDDSTGAPTFLGRPEAGQSVEEFTAAVLRALLGEDDPRVRQYEAGL